MATHPYSIHFQEVQSAALELRALNRQRDDILARFGWPAHFWSRVAVGGPDDCWEWQGGKVQPFGHGKFRRGGVVQGSHRAAYEMARGPIPSGMWVCHACDNPPCCNPAHLWLGTQADNNQDCWGKGRRSMPTRPADRDARGSANGRSKLTEVNVIEILQSPLNNVQLAAKFGVSSVTIGFIRNGKTWRHIQRTG